MSEVSDGKSNGGVAAQITRFLFLDVLGNNVSAKGYRYDPKFHDLGVK